MAYNMDSGATQEYNQMKKKKMLRKCLDQLGTHKHSQNEWMNE